MGKKIVVGMSGGVDSSMTLAILQDQGWEPVGVALKFSGWENETNCNRENVCCTDESLKLAKEVCDKFGVEFHTYNVEEEFKKEVMDYFVEELKNNRTPNPCVRCNREMKFKNLFKWAEENGIEYIATGHYAKIIQNKETKLFELHKAKDQTKDQTYGLCLFPQKWLAKMQLPLGEFTKEEVYVKAEEKGFEIYRKKKQSQDLCFVSKKLVPEFIREKVGEQKGDIISECGEILGTHKGIHFFTRGQKKGLMLSKSYCVKETDAETNAVVVTEDRNKLNSKICYVKDINFVSSEKITEVTEIQAKVRYGPHIDKAKIYPEDKKGITKIEFEEEQFAIANGQFCVIYQGNNCLGGGMILSH